MKVERSHTIELDFYTEGPAMDNDDNIFCTTLTGGKVLKIDPNGNISTWCHSSCPNGQIILPGGDHLVCDSQQGSILRFDSTGVFRQNEIYQTCNGEKISVPNDLIADSTDGIYFSDSARNEGKVGYRSADGEERIVVSGLDYPNGMALSKDQKTLFIAESYRNRIISVGIERAGVVNGDYKVFAELPKHSSGKAESNLPDGIAFDSNNQLWVAHYGMGFIQVLDKNGKLLDSIQMPFPLVSNVFISPKRENTIVVTGGFAEPGPGALTILTIKH